MCRLLTCLVQRMCVYCMHSHAHQYLLGALIVKVLEGCGKYPCNARSDGWAVLRTSFRKEIRSYQRLGLELPYNVACSDALTDSLLSPTMYTSSSLLLHVVSCLSVATVVTSFPTNDLGYSLSKRNATIEQSVFLDINGTQVVEKIARLKAEGYRPTSLSIHGSPTDARYAGIWTRQDGNPYETILGANKTTYEAWMDQLRTNGYVSTHVSATGSASDALFAGVMQQIPSVRNWVQQCGLNSPWLYRNGTMGTLMLIKSVSMYGVPNERQYCILGHENTVDHQQTVFYQTDSYQDDYKFLQASETSKRYWRPVFIDISEDQMITPIFDDTSVGKWAAITDLATSQLNSEIVARAAENMYPIHITGSGGTEGRYAVIFAERTNPLEREWHTTGAVTGYNDNSGISDALDQIMQDFMKR